MTHYQKWSVDETILITDWVKNRDGELPDQNSVEVAALRDKFFPHRSIDSVYLQAWHAQCALGYAQDNGSCSRQVLAVGALFQTDGPKCPTRQGRSPRCSQTQRRRSIFEQRQFAPALACATRHQPGNPIRRNRIWTRTNRVAATDQRKRGYGWDRARIDGTEGTRIWTGHGVLAHNLIKISALAA